MSTLITLGVDTDILSAALDAGTAVGLILIYFWLASFFVFPLISVYMLIFFQKTQLAIPIER